MDFSATIDKRDVEELRDWFTNNDTLVKGMNQWGLSAPAMLFVLQTLENAISELEDQFAQPEAYCLAGKAHRSIARERLPQLHTYTKLTIAAICSIIQV